MLLSQPALSALSIVIGLIVGWVAATLICGVLVTLLDIRDDINDRLPRAK
jgi:xanthine/uracil permease